MKELKQELANRERCHYSAVTHSGDMSTKEDQKLPPGKKSVDKGSPSTSALMAAGSDRNQKPTCVYCGQCSKAQGNFKEEWSLFHLYQEKSPQ